MRAARWGVGVVVLAAALLGVPAVPATAATRPANDDFANARTLTPTKGVAYGTVAGATIEATPSLCSEPSKAFGGQGDRSVWYRYTPTTNGWLRFDLHTYSGWTGFLDVYDHRASCYHDGWTAYTHGDWPSYGEMEVTRGKPIWLGVYSYGAENVGTFAVTWRQIARAAPVNDHLSAADVVWGRYGKVYGTNVNATRQSGEPAHAGRSGGRSAWYRWTAPASGPAMFHVAGDPRWDCLLAAYTGTSAGALTPVAANANTAPGNSCTVRFTARAGATYVLAVDGERGEEASYVLTWNSGPPPPHDAVTGARVVSGFTGVLNDTNRGARDEPGEPRHAPIRSGSSVWYRWTAPDDGEALIGAHSPPMYEPVSPWEHDKRVAVFTGRPDALTFVAASYDPPRTELNAIFTAERGRTYWVQVSGQDSQVVHYYLHWRLLPQTNDEFAEALPLPPTGSIELDTTEATAEPGEPGHGLRGYSPRNSLWFAWTAPATGTVVFDNYTEGGYFPTMALSAYTGDRLDALTRVETTHEYPAAGYQRWTFAAVAGKTYRIAVDDDDSIGWGRWYRLNWYYGAREFVPPVPALGGPAEGSVVRGVVTVPVSAADTTGVWSVGHSHDYAATFRQGPDAEPGPDDAVIDTEGYRDGPIRTKATAGDVLGNRAETPERILVVDNRPPAVSGIGYPPQLTNETSWHVAWESDEPVSRGRCSFDGGAYADCHDAVGGDRGAWVGAGLADGVHVVRVRLTDMQGNASVDAAAYWFIVDTKGVGVLPPDDTTPPVVTGPQPDLYTHPVGSATVPVRLSWSSRDATTGVQRQEMQVSVNGAAYQPMPLQGYLTKISYDLTPGRSYRFRVRAVDWANNVSGWAYGRRFGVGLAQENGGPRYSAGWRRVAMAQSSGGYVMHTTTAGATATYAFTGRSIALYGPRANSLGKSAVYLDGVRVATVDQWEQSGTARAALFVRDGLDPSRTHVLEVRSLGERSDPRGGTGVMIDALARLS